MVVLDRVENPKVLCADTLDIEALPLHRVFFARLDLPPGTSGHLNRMGVVAVIHIQANTPVLILGHVLIFAVPGKNVQRIFMGFYSANKTVVCIKRSYLLLKSRSVSLTFVPRSVTLNANDQDLLAQGHRGLFHKRNKGRHPGGARAQAVEATCPVESCAVTSRYESARLAASFTVWMA